MSLKKKLLIVALSLGTVLGFGSGLCHLRSHCCHRSEASWSWPCERSGHHGQGEPQGQGPRAPAGGE